MRKVLTALLTAGCFAAGMALSASTANAQVDAWNGGWHVGGDYYYPTYSSYEAAPVYAPAYSAAEYSYGAAPLYNYAAAPTYSSVGYGYGAAPLYDYGAAPAYGAVAYSYGAAPLYNYAALPAYSPAVYGYGAAPLYGAVPAYSPAVVGAQIQPVRTVEVVRTVYLSPRSAARRQTAIRQTAMPRTAGVIHARPQQNGTASNVAAPVRQNTAYNSGAGHAQPLYDTAAAPIAQPVAAPADARPAYRYVYQRDRTLVIDPSTNAVVQTLRH
jgi:hypothetical protein